jgi:hypothetical protein
MRKCMKRLLSEHGFNVVLFDSGIALLGRADFDGAFWSSLTLICVTNPA